MNNNIHILGSYKFGWIVRVNKHSLYNNVNIKCFGGSLCKCR